MSKLSFTALIAFAAVTATTASAEHIVSSRIISDTVVGESVAAGAEGTVAGNVIDGDAVYGGPVVGGTTSRTNFGQPDLFYNYYTGGASNTANAQMYLSPVPVPPNVGHTFYTYQPFYPHELLYPHKDRFHNYYDGGRGLNRTKVHYGTQPVRTGLSNFYWNALRLPR